MYTEKNIKNFWEEELKINDDTEGIIFLIDFVRYWTIKMWERERYIFARDEVVYGEIFERPYLKNEDYWIFVYKYDDQIEEELWKGMLQMSTQKKCTHFAFPPWKFHYQMPSRCSEKIIERIFGGIWENPIKEFTERFGEVEDGQRGGYLTKEWSFSMKKLKEEIN